MAENNSSQTPSVMPPIIGGGGMDVPPQPPSGAAVASAAAAQNQAPPPAAPNQPPVSVSTPPKRRSFKFVAILFLVLVVLGGLVFLVSRILPNFGGKSVTITWWGLWEPESVIAPIIAEYEQKNPNVKINYTLQSQTDYRERLANSLARGEGPDIFRLHNSWVPMFKNELSAMPQSVMSQGEFSQNFYPVFSQDLSSGGEIVAMPLEFDSLALFINEDIFESFAKSPPTSWDDLRSLARDLTIKDENNAIRQAGAALGTTANVDHWQEIVGLLMLQNKVKMTDPKGKLAEDALDFFSRFTRVDGVWDETLPSSTLAFAGGKVAMYFGPSWRVHEIKQLSPDLKFKVVKVPQLQKESESDPDISYATYWAEGVWEQSEGKQQAWEFLKFLSERETLTKFYQNASSVRAFGEPYPRVDMADLLTPDPIVSVFVSQGKTAKSWYLHSRTFDGPTGINSLLSKYFEDAVNSVNRGTSPSSAVNTAATGVIQVLAQYGLVAAPSPKAE